MMGRTRISETKQKLHYRRWNAKRRRTSSPFGILLRLPGRSLEGQAQPETDQTAVVDALLIEARVDSSKVFIARNVGDWEESACSLVHVETKAA